MTWLTKTFTAAVLAVSFTSVVHGETCLSDGSCALSDEMSLDLSNCGITDADIDDLKACFNSVGRANIASLSLQENDLTAIPSDLFEGMSALEDLFLATNDLTTIDADAFQPIATTLKILDLNGNQLETLPAGVFAGLEGIKTVVLSENMLTALDADIFSDMYFPSVVNLGSNALTSLPAGIFEKLSISQIILAGNSLDCFPTFVNSGIPSAATEYYGVTYSYSTLVTGDCCACTDVATCDGDLKCNPGDEGYTCDATALLACTDDTNCDTDYGATCSVCGVCEGGDDPAGASGDPHMTGFRGQRFDFTGEDGKWYALVSDLPYMHLNMRVTSPIPSVPEVTYITGISIVTTDDDGLDHSIVVSVKNPHSMESSCAAGVPSCLADGALHVVIDGEEVLVTPGEVTIAPGVAIAAVNLPGACRSFGFEMYWERKMLENSAQPSRRLKLEKGMQDMSDWVLADPTATNVVECAEYVAHATAVDGVGLFAYESEHVSFQIMTPTATIRLSHGRLHQLPMRDPTDQFDLPDHLAWQMNLAIDHSDMSLDATGILGETLVPTLHENGAPIMEGMAAIRGTQEDYRVGGPLDVLFSQGQRYD